MSIDVSPQIIATDGAGLVYNKHDLGTTTSYQFGYALPDDIKYTAILGGRLSPSTPDAVFRGYYFKIYYNGTEIYNSGESTDVDSSGNPINWPPPINQYQNISLAGSTIKTAAVVPFTNNLGAPPNYYILPDIHYESIKNGISINGNTSIENTIQAGTHFKLGSFRSTTQYDVEPGNAQNISYYGITKLSSPPTIYRNTLAVDDGSDEEFNDAIFVLNKGDGFFTGETTIAGGFGTDNLNDKPYSYSNLTNQTWSKTYNTFVANTTGRYEFQVKRNAGSKNKILLHPGTGASSGPDGGSSTQSSNWAIIEPGNQNVSTVNVTLDNLQAGTYEVALRRNNVTRSQARLHVRHIDINKYPTLPGT